MRKVISLFLIFVIILNTIKIQSFASETDSNRVYTQQVTFDPETNPWGYVPLFSDKCFVIDDATGIPTGGNYAFYKIDDDTFGSVEQGKLYTLIFNKTLGLVFSSELLATTINNYITALQAVFGGSSRYCGYLYTNTGVNLGVCLNDISGCRYINAPANTNINIPSTIPNNVYKWYQYDRETNRVLPDYVNVECKDKSYFLNRLDKTSSSYNKYVNLINLSDLKYLSFSYNRSTTLYTPRYDRFLKYDKAVNFVALNSQWSTDFINAFNLSTDNNTIPYNDLLINSGTQTFNSYDSETYQQLHTYTFASGSAVENGSAYNDQSVGSSYLPCYGEKYITIYRTWDIYTQVVNNVYAPTTYTSQDYRNYNTSNDNSVTTTNTQIDNSTSNNTTIYNESSSSFKEYYEENNNNIDNSVTISNTTTIINNYYGDGSGDDPEGGGGSGGDSGDSDNPIWNKLLDAIIGFFKKIGELLASVITGILGLLDEVIDAIANVTTNFDSINTFIRNVLGFLPEDVVAILMAAFSLGLLITLIKLFTK